MELDIKKRSYHVISGRLRTELYGLKNNPDIALHFEQAFSSIKGILHVETNIISGKILLQYDENIISLEEMCLHISQFEEKIFKQFYGFNEVNEDAENTEVPSFSQVAATYDFPTKRAQNQGASQKIVSSILRYLPKNQLARAPADEKVPLPLALSVSGLGILGIKQLFFGRSILARHPLAFYLAAALSVSTGYSFIKRRLQKFWRGRRVNIDLLLSASALTLALIRENLIVLAALSLIQYLNWKRASSNKNGLMDQEFVTEEIDAYSRRASKLGFIGAGAALAVTRNPIVSLGVLLAANPRPIIISTEYAWKQAEYVARENNQAIPINGSVYQLARTKYVVFEDASLLTANGAIRKECIPLLTHIPGGKVAVVNNELKGTLNNLEKNLMEYGVQLTSHQDLNINSREEVLVVVKDKIAENNKVISFYPYCTFGQLSSITKTMENSKDLRKIVKRNILITRIWNVAGSIIAFPMIISAPLINLIGDALSLTFMSKAKNWTERRFAPPYQKQESGSNEGISKFPWHTKGSEEILRYYKIDAHKGLSTEQVKQALPLYGKNQLVSKARSHWMKTYLGQFKEFTTQVLGATALLSAFTGHLFDGIIMGAILLINAGIGAFQERKADRAVETMSQFVPPNCRVVRDGILKEIEAYDLVPGDIVELEAGDRIPADLRILQAWNLEANESALTGESLPVGKKDAVLTEGTPITDRTNILYMGTHITRGKCIAVVVQTGKNTEMGHLLALLSEDEDHTTPLQKQVTAISKKFMKGALIVGAIVFVTGLLRGIPITEMVTTSVALTASAIPEGLPITITFALTAGIFRMANKKALVRKLSALETLGRTTVICSDKTGTLTKNEMTVKRIVTIDQEFEVTGDGYHPEGTIIGLNHGKTASKEVDQLLSIALHCNDSQLYQEDGRWNVKGDPTEGALLSLAAKRGVFRENHTHWKRAGEIPFDSTSGKMSVVCHEDEHEDQCLVMSKGSVEKLLHHCTHYQTNGKAHSLTNKIRSQIIEKNDQLASQALRVLGFAYRELDNFDGKMDDVDRNLIFVGMVGMIDPPKPEVERSIREAVELGIKPVMITGDHPLTALSIAKQIGIFDDKKKVVTGQELDHLSDEALKDIIDDIAIYARVTPEHKLRIVTTLQEKGHIVAMTGDGVNDSPAIKKADVGIAMGQTGTQVTKETADMVLKEDHFGSIVDGVKEGRTIIGNIRKAIGCLLSGNLAEILASSAAVMAGMPLPIVPVQILLMNMLTDALPAMILAVNPGKKNKETKRQEIVDSDLYKQVITRGAILGTGSLGLFIWCIRAGMTIASAQTVAFATLVAGQLIQTFSWRQAGSGESINDLKKDRFLVGALGISWLSLLGVIYIPPLAGIFKTVALPLWNWGPILLVAMAAARLSKPVSKIWISRRPLVNSKNGLAVA
ncbi:cation-translocating P-type ATPase [Neobacillus ginsengisoli]|uniref:Magnesium-transporting ATPase (P-type) n=1 Tax=Neobacillus ginsengisoli TaxID=904295 RepID=A0ABT9XU90_9BACI|nr:HAD-IC family P-type ATPase [Neobacillus ginsengisoli]MDQ0199112.1 magnesium-transporting ATPase (P-type) [Neobacillus ginsengisoli]